MKWTSISRGMCSTLLTLWLSFAASTVHAAEDTIKVGILHSLSGTMAISESVLKDTVLMMIADQNRKGGLLGKKLEPVVVDPASDWDAFAEKARELLAKEKVAVVFGCWTSASRKAVLPVFEQLNGLLFYPVQYEGEESSRNIFYTGAAPSQQAIPAVRYLMSKEGGEVRRWVLLGTDYVYPRMTNRILSAYLAAEGVHAEDITTIYTPFGHSDWREIVARIKAFGSAGKKTAVISTINGDANTHFYHELVAQQVDASKIPVMALSVGERELLGAGHRAGSPDTSRHGTTSNPSSRRKTTRSSRCGPTSTSSGTRPRMIRWRPLSSALGCGRRPSPRPAQPTSMRSGKPCTVRGLRRRAALRW